MTHFPEEWLDAKLANIRRWKAEEAKRSAKINASSAGAPTRKDGGQTTRPASSGANPAAAAPINAARADAATDRADAGTTAGTLPSPGADAAHGGTKYRNKRTNGYASKREAKRASELRLMTEAGTIRNLREQVEFLLIPRQKRPDGTVAERSCSYFADFVYDEFRDGDWRQVVEDTKGFRTPDYIIKRKLVLFVHGIEIREV